MLHAGDVQWMLAGRRGDPQRALDAAWADAHPSALVHHTGIGALERASDRHDERVIRRSCAASRASRRACTATTSTSSFRAASGADRHRGCLRSTRARASSRSCPSTYNGFVYVLEGTVSIGEERGTVLRAGQVGWLDRPTASAPSVARPAGEGERARVVLYAGEPQHRPDRHPRAIRRESTRADLMRVVARVHERQLRARERP